jgi:hypothetical protein
VAAREHTHQRLSPKYRRNSCRGRSLARIVSHRRSWSVTSVLAVTRLFLPGSLCALRRAERHGLFLAHAYAIYRAVVTRLRPTTCQTGPR